MISLSSLRKNYLFIAVIAVVFSLLQYYQIPYQFYFWEIFVDLKIVSLLIFLLFQWKRKELRLEWEMSGIFQWQWKGNILWFFYPAALLIIVVLAAFIMNQVNPEEVDNASTIILQTIFDIPAIFVFSATSIFMEEFFFRSIMFRSQLQHRPVIQSVLINAFFWTLFYLPEIVSIDNDAIHVLIAVALFIFSYGFLLCFIIWKNATLWYGYSFRIGISVILPLFFSSNFVDSGTFFKTDSVYFSAEGITFSILFLITAVGLYYKGKMHISEENQKIRDREVFS